MLTLNGRAIQRANAMTESSRMVLGTLALGIRPKRSKRAMDTPGTMKMGKEVAMRLIAV